MPTRSPVEKQLAKMPENDDDRHDAAVLSEEEIEDDFEPMNYKPHPRASTSRSLPASAARSRRSDRQYSSTGTMTTVRLKRRARLADKLRDIFDLDGIREVIAGMPQSWTLCLVDSTKTQKCHVGS
jgi:sterol 3beta-glucosyltransferase